MPGKSPKMQITLFPPEFAEEVYSRAPLAHISERGRVDLDRYYTLLQRSRIDFSFSPDEALFLVRILADKVGKSVRDAKLLRFDIKEALETEKPTNVSYQSLVGKLDRLTLLDWVALLDAVERYHLVAQRGPNIPSKNVRLVGLTRD